MKVKRYGHASMAHVQTFLSTSAQGTKVDWGEECQEKERVSQGNLTLDETSVGA